MITSWVTPPAKEEGVEMDEAEGVGGAVDPDRLKKNCAVLYLTVATSIVEGKMSLSRVVESLCTSMMERMK